MAAMETVSNPMVRADSSAVDEELDGETISDLTWAFLATDLDHSATLDPNELTKLLRVLADGTDVTIEEHEIEKIMITAKENFKQYRKDLGMGNYLPDEYQYPTGYRQIHADVESGLDIDGSGLIEKDLHAGGLLVVRDVASSGAVFDNEETGSKKAKKRRRHLEEKYQKTVPNGAHPTLSKFYLDEPMKLAKKTMSVAADITEIGLRATMKVVDTAVDVAQESIETVGEIGSESAIALGLMERTTNVRDAANELRFGEFIYMMQTKMLDPYFPDHDWRHNAREVHTLRMAFDNADVDGDDQLEQGEFEMVLDTLHMGHDLSADDVNYAWQLLINSSGDESAKESNSLTFFQFMVGVQAVKRDPRLKDRIDLAMSSPWQMLSLLIDTPVSESEHDRLMQELSPIERLGIKLLDQPEYTQPMHRENIKTVLQECVQGRLHYLNEQKVNRMNKVWLHFVFQATLIGFVSTGITTPIENWATWAYRTDGAMDIDCVCYTRGCGVNPGSLPVSPLQPGDATIPGFNRVPYQRYYDEYDANGTLIMHAWSLGQDADDAWVNGDYDRIGCKEGHPGKYVPATLRKPDEDGNEYPKQLREHGIDIPGGLNCTRLPLQRADSRRSYDIDIEEFQTKPASPQKAWKVDECFGPGWASIGWFWLPVGASVLICCAIEISVLMYFGVLHSIRVAWALGYRLTPLNKDRAFLADSLVRGAFELGNPESAVFGVDPLAETGTTGKFRLILMGLSWKGKILVTGVLMKFVWGVVFPWEGAVWFKPWLSMPADMFWNGMTAHIIMKQAQIRGVGVAVRSRVVHYLLHLNLADKNIVFM